MAFALFSRLEAPLKVAEQSSSSVNADAFLFNPLVGALSSDRVETVRLLDGFWVGFVAAACFGVSQTFCRCFAADEAVIAVPLLCFCVILDLDGIPGSFNRVVVGPLLFVSFSEAFCSMTTATAF